MSPMRRPLACWLLLALSAIGSAQEVLSDMPRFDRYDRLRKERANAIVSGAASSIVWNEDKTGFSFSQGGKTWRFDLKSKQKSEGAAFTRSGDPRNRRAPERGRQFDTVTSADGKLKAFHRDRNVYLSDADGKNERAVTTDGSADKRTKYGIASWVYGEELGVREAMWFSPDGKRLAYYFFDEGKVKDYYLALAQTKFQSELDVEAYPKAGTDNPTVGLYVYDLASGKSTKIDTSFGDATLGEYVYDVKWAPKGDVLLFNRTNRKQNVMQLCAADPATGKSRMVVEERQLQSWAENHPDVRFLEDQNRFIWSTERSGFKNFHLYDLSGKDHGALTDLKLDAMNILAVDEKAGTFAFTSAGERNPYHVQLRTAPLKPGGKSKVLTNEDFHNTVTLEAGTGHAIVVEQTVDQAPRTRLISLDGKEVAVLAESDTSKVKELGLRPTRLFKFKAADGVTELYGTYQVPSDYVEGQRYPVILDVYGGPESGGARVTYQVADPLTEFGFVRVNLAGRGTNGRGKAFRDAVYGKLGVVEIDDQAAGIKELVKLGIADPGRVGIYGTSYGGYSSIMAILRHPDVFRSAAASSSVTDWRHYDTIYTERFMGLPWENENLKGYEAGSAYPYVKDLKGNLMLFFGSSDNNVHPSNTYMLVQKLQQAGKRYEMQIGPDIGHAQMNATAMWEFFMRTLILNPKSKPQAALYQPGRATVVRQPKVAK